MAGGRFASQATEDALLKYQPQQSALQSLMREAEEAYRGSVRGGESAARLGVQAVKEGVPQVAGVYNRAEAQNKQVQDQAMQALSALPGVDNGYKAAATNEGAAATQRIAGNRASVLGQLHLQGVAAANSAASSRQAASTTLTKELGKLFGKSQELSGQQGAFASSELERLTHESEKEQRGERQHGEDIAQRERGSVRSSGIDPNTGKPIPGGRLDKHAAGELPLKEQNKAASTIRQIKQFAEKFKEAVGGSRSHLVERLSEGVPAQTFGTGEKDAEGKEVKAKHSGIPAFKPDVLMSAALDWALGGYLSPQTEQRLQQAGYSIPKLGVPGAQRRGETERAGARAGKGAGNIARGLGHALGVR